jgi:hypothetical protein
MRIQTTEAHAPEVSKPPTPLWFEDYEVSNWTYDPIAKSYFWQFLRAYLDKASNAVFVPKDQDDLKLLLWCFLILKALDELRYELNNRPKWVAIPLRGILRLLEEGVTQIRPELFRRPFHGGERGTCAGKGLGDDGHVSARPLFRN